MKEFGIIDYLMKKALASSSRCPNPTSFQTTADTLRSLALQDFYGVFFIWVGGELYNTCYKAI